MAELEVRGGPGRAVPDQAARAHHGMERVHADEDARHGHAHLVQPPREAVDHLLERQVAQAPIGQPVGERGECRHDGLPRLLGPAFFSQRGVDDELSLIGESADAPRP